MRTIVVLLCLGLTQTTFGSIFRNQPRQQWDSLIVQPLDNIERLRLQQVTAHRSKSSESHESNDSSSTTSSQSNEQRNKNWNAPVNDDDTSQNNLITKHNKIQYQIATSFRPVQRKNEDKIFDDALSTLQHITESDKRKIHEAFALSENEIEEAEKNATDLLLENGYRAEELVVKTEDGYQLKLYRIQPKETKQNEQNRPVVLLVHGFLGSADDWLLMGPEKSLAYQMVDAGFDVYLGNVRGSKYSRRHSTKHPGQSDFWQFSIDEIAAQDLPAMIDRALKVSGQTKLFYVGHSQGTTAFFAMASTKPEYRDKVIMMYALSPMVYMTHVRSPLLRMVAPNSRFYKPVHKQLGHGEFKPSKDFIRRIGGKMCEDVVECEHICSNVNYVISGVDSTGMDKNLVPVVTKHRPAGASTKQIKQYGQTKAAKEFRKYDHGKDINMKVYGQPQPPKYNVTEVNVPVGLYYSEEDWLAHPEDVERLYRELPNVKDYYKVSERHFSSMDFHFSDQAPNLINQRLVEMISTIDTTTKKYGDW